MIRRFLILLVIGTLNASPAFAELDPAGLARSIVTINLYDGKVLTDRVSGAVVQADRFNGYVITNNALVDVASTITVSVPSSGAELIAQVQWSDLVLDIALLKVNGLNLPAMAFAKGPPQAGGEVWLAAKTEHDNTSIGLSRGVLATERTGGRVGLYAHTAQMTRPAAGAVLLNECGHLVGLNQFSQVGQAINLDGLQTLLAGQNVKVRISDEGCLSAVAMARQKADEAALEARRAQAEAEQAQTFARSLEVQLARSTEQNEALTRQTREARELADSALAAAERARANAESNRLELEAKTRELREEAARLLARFEQDQVAAEGRFREILATQQESSRLREYLLMGLVGLLVVVILVMLIRGRRPAALAPAATAPPPVAAASGGDVPGPAPAAPPVSQVESPGAGQQVPAEPARFEEVHEPTLVPDPRLKQFVLDGRDEDGIRYLLRIAGEQLEDPEGVTIGRNPKGSPYVINHADVSRQHARLKVMKDRIFLEDLDSTNGTSVNGQAIDGRGPVSVDSGDQIIIGSVVMNLKVMPGQ